VPSLRDKVTGAIERRLGRVLQEAWYNCIEGEIEASGLEDPTLFIGGDVELRFAQTPNLFVGWDENAGWECPFSLVVTETSAFSGGLAPWSATRLYPWSEAIGTVLRRASVYGRDGTPFILQLAFESDRSIFIGTGWQQTFGDGDDILIRSSENMVDLSDWDLLWSGSAA
jgi:hypothetical protein